MVSASKSPDPDIDAIVVDHLTKQFGAFTAVDNISFQVKKGELFALLGPNSAGKNTTIKMLTTPLKRSALST